MNKEDLYSLCEAVVEEAISIEYDSCGPDFYCCIFCDSVDRIYYKNGIKQNMSNIDHDKDCPYLIAHKELIKE